MEDPHVHFAPTCALIPEHPSGRPRFSTRSFSVSLPPPRNWIPTLSGGNSCYQLDHHGPASLPAKGPSLTVKIPSFTRRAEHTTSPTSELRSCMRSSSTSRARSRSRSLSTGPNNGPVLAPLGSALDEIMAESSPDASTSTLITSSHVHVPTRRRNSVQAPTSATVPLRSCCEGCLESLRRAGRGRPRQQNSNNPTSYDDADQDEVMWSPGARKKKLADEAEARELIKLGEGRSAAVTNRRMNGLSGILNIDELGGRHHIGGLGLALHEPSEQPLSEEEEETEDDEAETLRLGSNHLAAKVASRASSPSPVRHASPPPPQLSPSLSLSTSPPFLRSPLPSPPILPSLTPSLSDASALTTSPLSTPREEKEIQYNLTSAVSSSTISHTSSISSPIPIRPRERRPSLLRNEDSSNKLTGSSAPSSSPNQTPTHMQSLFGWAKLGLGSMAGVV